jgi:hypothetical protein
MKTTNTPGFTAEASFCKTGGRYRASVNQTYSSGEQNVISQMRAGGGGTLGGFGGMRTGFWRELACALACAPLLEDPPLYAACVLECI